MMTMDELKLVHIHVCGVCPDYGGPAGYGAVLSYNHRFKELSEGFSPSTLKRIQLIAIVTSLRALKYKCQVYIYSSDEYLVTNMSNGRIRSISKTGWSNGRKKRLAHSDLWRQILDLCEFHEVEFKSLSSSLYHGYCTLSEHLANSAVDNGRYTQDTAFEATELFSYINTNRHKRKMRKTDKCGLSRSDQGYQSSEEAPWIYDPHDEAWYICEDEDEVAANRDPHTPYQEALPGWRETKRMQNSTEEEYYHYEHLEDGE